MSNRIQVHCDFCFKGEYLTPNMEVDLDELMKRHGSLPDFYSLLAEANHIGLYSYEYEMLEAEPLQITALEGWVADYVEDSSLDIDGFEHTWHKRHLEQQFREILTQQGLDSQDGAMLAAMRQAYHLGLHSRRT